MTILLAFIEISLTDSFWQEYEDIGVKCTDSVCFHITVLQYQCVVAMVFRFLSA